MPGDLFHLERRFDDLLGTLAVMTLSHPLRAPAAGEFAPFFAGYINRVSQIVDPIGDLDAQRARFLGLLKPLSDGRAAYRYAENKWSIKELVGHLADAERILSYRLLRIGRGDETPLAGWDENAYARSAGFDDRPWSGLLEDWTAARDSTVALVRGLPDEAWDRDGIANESPVTARALLYIILGHVEHHCAVLKERYGV